MAIVTTTEILGRKALLHPVGGECVDWAIGMLEKGSSSRSIAMLASLSPPLHHFELVALRDRALEEIGVAPMPPEEAIARWVEELALEASDDPAWRIQRLKTLSDLSIELGHPSYLDPFYLLHNAWQDLQHQRNQYYWKGATRENIDEIVRETFQRYRFQPEDLKPGA